MSSRICIGSKTISKIHHVGQRRKSALDGGCEARSGGRSNLDGAERLGENGSAIVTAQSGAENAKSRCARGLDVAQEFALADRIRRGDSDAQQDMIVANLGLVSSIAKRYIRSGVSREDLVQEGTLGLIRASRDFDPRARGVRFATYAAVWIRSFMYRALLRDTSLIRVPRTRRLSAQREVTGDSTNKEGTQWETREGHEVVGRTIDRANWFRGQSALRREMHPVRERMNRISPSGGDLDDLAADSRHPDEVVSEGEDQELVARAMSRLSLVEAWVIYERFGLHRSMVELAGRIEQKSVGLFASGPEQTDVGKGKTSQVTKKRPRYYNATYVELGGRLGLSTYRVRQIEQIAVAKLREFLGSLCDVSA
jgi:RNA polymerase sigma factor (sigma-70 family)